MSAQPVATAKPERVLPKLVELTLDRKAVEIRISCASGSHVQVNVYVKQRDKRERQRIVFALANLSSPDIHRRDSFRLDLKYTSIGPSLWLGLTSFELTADEGKRVEEAFAAHGMQVERTEVKS